MNHTEHEWHAFDKFLRTLRIQKVKPHIQKNTILCDLGCGQEAHLLRTLQNHIERGYGFDMLVNGFEENNIKVERAHLVDTIPLEDKSIDVVTLLASLEHLSDDRSIVREMYRILRPGGAALVTVPTPYGKWLLEAMAHTGIINKAEILDHKRYYTKKDVHALLLGGGFQPHNISARYWELGGNLFVRAIKEL